MVALYMLASTLSVETCDALAPNSKSSNTTQNDLVCNDYMMHQQSKMEVANLLSFRVVTMVGQSVGNLPWLLLFDSLRRRAGVWHDIVHAIKMYQLNWYQI